MAQAMAQYQIAMTAHQAAAQARFEKQDRERQILQQLEEVVLSQDQVVNELIPRANKRWQGLASGTATGALTLDELDKTFGKLPEAQLSDELRVLFSTTGE